MKVFVYGTLKSGHGNNVLLNGAKLVGEAILPDHTLYYSGGGYGFPVANVEEGKQVKGEVWEIEESHLYRLDCLEGYDPQRPEAGMYRRLTFTLDGEDVSYYLGGSWWNFDTLTECETDDEGNVVWGNQ